MAEPTIDSGDAVEAVAEIVFYDFDAAMGELEERPFGFTYGGENYVVDLNVDAGKMLLFMENAVSLTSIPTLLRVFLDDEQFAAIAGAGEPFQKLELLVTKFAEELGSGSGN